MKGHRKGGYDLDNPSTWCEYPSVHPREPLGQFTCWNDAVLGTRLCPEHLELLKTVEEYDPITWDDF